MSCKGGFSEKGTHPASARMDNSKKAMRTFGKYLRTALQSSSLPYFLFGLIRLREVKPMARVESSERELWLSAKPHYPKHQGVSLELEQERHYARHDSQCLSFLFLFLVQIF